MINLSDIKDNRYAVIGSLGFVGRPLTKYLKENLCLKVVEIDKDTNPKLYKKAEVFFVAVPTPTSCGKFCSDIIHSVVSKIPDETLVIIRSTVPPWIVRLMIACNPKKTFVVVPEFLDADSATLNFHNPYRLVVGVDRPDTMASKDIAKFVLEFFPGNTNKERNFLMSIEEACLTKYAANAFFLLKNVFFNQIYDIAAVSGMDYKKVAQAVAADPRIGATHTKIPHKGGRGAGGGCLVKDFEIFKELAKAKLSENDLEFLTQASKLNLWNLRMSDKDQDIVRQVFGCS